MDRNQTFPHVLHKVDHTGRGVSQSAHRTLADALRVGRERKAATVPSVLAGNSWYVSTSTGGGLTGPFAIEYVR